MEKAGTTGRGERRGRGRSTDPIWRTSYSERGATNRKGEHRRDMERESEYVQNKGRGGGILGFARGL